MPYVGVKVHEFGSLSDHLLLLCLISIHLADYLTSLKESRKALDERLESYCSCQARGSSSN